MEIYQRYGAALLRKAERILLNHEDALDVVQGLFVDLWERKNTDVELPYLYRAVTHRCLSLIRDRKNRQRLLTQQQPALRGPERIDCEGIALTMNLLIKLTEGFDERAMEIFVCRFVDEMTQEEIATSLKISRKTVGRRLDAIVSAVQLLTREEAES